MTIVLLLYFKWNFFIHQWTDRIETFKNEIQISTEADQTIRGLAMILTILIHDCIFKLLKIFYFSRFKPAALNFTVTQLVGPVVDILMVMLSFITIINQLLKILKTREDLVVKYRHMLYTSLYNAVYPFCLNKREQQVLRYRRRKYADEVLKARDNNRLATLIVILFIIPIFYMVFKFLACWIEILMSVATFVDSQEALQSRQLAVEQMINTIEGSGMLISRFN